MNFCGFQSFRIRGITFEFEYLQEFESELKKSRVRLGIPSIENPETKNPLLLSLKD
jgi:hypothetical protein